MRDPTFNLPDGELMDGLTPRQSEACLIRLENGPGRETPYRLIAAYMRISRTEAYKHVKAGFAKLAAKGFSVAKPFWQAA